MSLALASAQNFVPPAGFVLPKPADDAGLVDGSLLMIDMTHSLSLAFGPAGVPAANAAIYNVAWKQAAALIGSGDQNTLAAKYTSSLTTTDALSERTSKGGLHTIMSQTAHTAAHNAGFTIPAAILAYMNANPTHAYGWWRWAFVDRLATQVDGNSCDFSIASPTSPASNFLFKVSGGAGNSLGFTRASQSVTGWTGTAPGTTTNESGIEGWGGVGPFAGLSGNHCKSYVHYRTHIIDITAASAANVAAGGAALTFPILDAADLGLSNSLFAVGGRLYGDAWANNPSGFP